jgi:hypothetical protein
MIDVLAPDSVIRDPSAVVDGPELPVKVGRSEGIELEDPAI